MVCSFLLSISVILLIQIIIPLQPDLAFASLTNITSTSTSPLANQYSNDSFVLNDFTTLYNDGVHLLKEGNYEAALNKFDAATSVNPNKTNAWHNKGLAYDNLGNYDMALRAYDTAISIDPTVAATWNAKGTTLFKAGLLNDSIASYNIAITLDPTNEKYKINKEIASKKTSASDTPFKDKKEGITFDNLPKLDLFIKNKTQLVQGLMPRVMELNSSNDLKNSSNVIASDSNFGFTTDIWPSVYKGQVLNTIFDSNSSLKQPNYTEVHLVNVLNPHQGINSNISSWQIGNHSYTLPLSIDDNSRYQNFLISKDILSGYYLINVLAGFNESNLKVVYTGKILIPVDGLSPALPSQTAPPVQPHASISNVGSIALSNNIKCSIGTTLINEKCVQTVDRVSGLSLGADTCINIDNSTCSGNILNMTGSPTFNRNSISGIDNTTTSSNAGNFAAETLSETNEMDMAQDVDEEDNDNGGDGGDGGDGGGETNEMDMAQDVDEN